LDEHPWPSKEPLFNNFNRIAEEILYIKDDNDRLEETKWTIKKLK